MSLLKKFTADKDVAPERDVVGGGSYVLDSDLYKMEITLAYLSVAKSEAIAVNFHFKNEQGKELRSQQWISSGKEKGGNNYYVDKEGNKQFLPGFVHANGIARLTVGKELADLEPEEKVVKLYSAEAKAEVPTKVQVLTELIGQEVGLGVIKQIVNKNVKNAEGNYVPSADTREENDIDKIFRAKDLMTAAEVLAGAEEATFADNWKAKWTGQVRDRSKAGANGVAGAGSKPGSPATKKPEKSLFGA